MDPLSIIGTVIALGQAADASGHALRRLLSLRNAPAQLEATMNELTDFRALLSIVQTSLDIVVPNEHEQALLHLDTILNRGLLVVGKLDNLIETRLIHSDQASDILKVRKRGFLKEGRLTSIRAELREVRQSIMAALTALQTAQLAPLPKLLLAVQSVTTVVQSNNSLPRQIPLMIEDGKAQDKSIERALSAEGLPDCESSVGFQQENTSVVIQTTAIGGRCLSYCPCQCHQRSTGQTPVWLKSLFGVMFYESAGFPILNRRPCNWRKCQHVSNSGAKFEYRFPSWLLNVIVSASVVNSLDGITARWSIKVPEFTKNEPISVAMLQRDDPEEIQRMMWRYKVSPQAIFSQWGISLLEYALTNRRLKTVRMLTEHGANWHYRGSTGISPFQYGWSAILLYPSWQKHGDELKQLLSRVDTLEAMQFSPLHKVISGLSDGNLRNLLELDPSLVSKPDAAGQTPLAWAVMKHDRAAVKELLNAGADAELKKSKTNAIFALASDIKIMKMLLDAGADVDGCDGRGVTAFRCCVSAGRLDRVKWLLEHGANPDLPKAYPPICEAAAHGSYDMLRVLLDHGISLESTTYTGFTPMMLAIARNQNHVFDLLLSRGARLDTVTPKGVDIFWIVAQKGHIDTMKFLTAMKLHGFDMGPARVKMYWKRFHSARWDRPTKTPNATKEEEMNAFAALLESVMPEVEDVTELDEEVGPELREEHAEDSEEYLEKTKQLPGSYSDDPGEVQDNDDDNNDDDAFTDALESINAKD